MGRGSHGRRTLSSPTTDSANDRWLAASGIARASVEHPGLGLSAEHARKQPIVGELALEVAELGSGSIAGYLTEPVRDRLAQRAGVRVETGSWLSRLGYQCLAVRSTCPMQELIEEPDPVVPFKAEPLGIRGDCLGNHSWEIKDPFQDLTRDLGHGIDVGVVGQELPDHPACPGRRQPAEQDPSLLRHPAPVDANVEPPRLASPRDRELMDIGAQVTDSVEAGSRGVGHHGDVRIVKALPGWVRRVELEPGGTEVEVIWLRCAAHAVHPVRDSLEETDLHEPRQ